MVSVMETRTFLRQAKSYLSDEEREDLVSFLAANPTAGEIMVGTGGVRKFRWSRRGEGKRGSFRVVHFFKNLAHPLGILGIYSKTDHEAFLPDELNELKKEAHSIELCS